jgi:2'-5' RNA ligase superfamily protein
VRHALLVPFPELLPLVEQWLERTNATGPSQGIPPHVTVLSPAAPSDIGDALDGFEAFDVEFRETRRFAEVVYLAPEPPEPFAEMTRAVWSRFPEWPPYGGEFLPDITPHPTVAWGALLDEAEADVRPRLPVRVRAREALLLGEVETGRWEQRASYPLR